VTRIKKRKNVFLHLCTTRLHHSTHSPTRCCLYEKNALHTFP